MLWRNLLIAFLSLTTGGLGFLAIDQSKRLDETNKQLARLSKPNIALSSRAPLTKGAIDLENYEQWLEETLNWSETTEQLKLVSILESRKRDTILRLIRILQKREIISQPMLDSVIFNDSYENNRKPISQIVTQIYNLTPSEIETILLDLKIKLNHLPAIWGQEWQ